jgi:PAS domain S-box-containing protein
VDGLAHKIKELESILNYLGLGWFFVTCIDDKEAEKALKSSEYRFRSLFESSLDAIVITSPDGRAYAANPAAERLFGMRQDEIVQAGRAGVMVLDEKAKQEIKKAQETGKARADFTYKRKDGSTFIGETTVSLFSDVDGTVKTTVLIRDVSERKKVEEKIRESEERYRSLFSNMDEAFALHEMLFDKQGVPVDYRFLEVNEAFERQTGLKASQIIGKTVCKVLPDLEPFWLETYGKVVITGESVRFENFNQSTKRYYEVYAFRPAQGRFGVMFSDITERKQAEARLEEYKNHLEQLVEERTRQLKISERLAGIGQTAGMVGHDIRNPLQAITSDLYLIQKEISENPTCVSEGITESITAIEENINYINKIVSDLQDYTKTLKQNLVKTNLKDIINVELAGRKIPNSISVEVEAETNLELKTDQYFLRRILANLITNAVQSMPGGGKLTIASFKEDTKAFICIQDTGTGIPEEVKPNLFKPLFTTKAKGQGLGLAVVKRLVEVLNGTISFESEEGKGTKFIIELPINQ